MNTKLVLILICAVMYTSLAFAQNQAQQFEGFNLEGYDNNGEKSWDIRGDTADIQGSEITLSNVDANAYGEQPMNIKAETGKIDQVSGKMLLEKDVIVTSEQGSQLVTDSINWDRELDLVSTQDDVVITDQRMMVTGKGMEATPSLKKATIEENVTVRVNTIDDVDQPADYVTITSDGPMVIDQINAIATFEDNVVAVQGIDRTLKADRMEVYFDVDSQQIKEIICIGNVKVIQGENQTFAERAVYSAAAQKLTLYGRPKLILITEGDHALTNLRN